MSQINASQGVNMLPLNKRVGDYIAKFPNQKLLIHHGDMVFTFHNAKILECLWFVVKTIFQRKPKGTAQADTASEQFIVDPKTRQATIIRKDPKDMKLMERIMSQFKGSGEVNPNKKPPKGKAIRWDDEKGYHYVSKSNEHSTFNRWIKSKNTKPKGDNNDGF
jgi:hypothetical protein